MNEMRKLMEAIENIVESDEGRNNISKITTRLCAEHDENVSNILTDKLRGQTVQLYVLGKHGGRNMNWAEVEVKVNHVKYSEHDVNGPVYVATDGQEYHSHPDHDVRVV